jgi:hypothetical protein
MLAEHDLFSELAFANPNGHIPSSQFEISMHFAALRRWRRQTLHLPVRILLSDRPFRGANGELPKNWWRRTGSNRRPDACKATALPAELRPLILVGLGRLERPTSPLSGVRSNHLSYRPRAGTDRQPLRSQRCASDPAIRMRKRNEGGLSRSRQMRP